MTDTPKRLDRRRVFVTGGGAVRWGQQSPTVGDCLVKTSKHLFLEWVTRMDRRPSSSSCCQMTRRSWLVALWWLMAVTQRP